jgi:hypothetical protein
MLLSDYAAVVERPRPDPAAQGKKLRDRAEECRALAGMMTFKENAASYLHLAEAYDALAEQEERLARDRFFAGHASPVSAHTE